MSKKSLPTFTLTLEKIVGGGQALGTFEDGRKAFVWGGLPGETVICQMTKKKSSFVEGVVIEVLAKSPERVEPLDRDSYLSTSPWQLMTPTAESHYKSSLIEEAFELHNIVLPGAITVFSDEQLYHYRNKVEFSFWFHTDTDALSLAFFRRGTHGKIPVAGTSLAMPVLNQVAQDIVHALNRLHVSGRDLKTLVIRCNQQGNVAWQLYVKEETFPSQALFDLLPIQAYQAAEVIFSNPKSPASVITERLLSSSDEVLHDTLLDVTFSYATEGFFQINLPVYQQALQDMKAWVDTTKPLVDLYSGVGTIGLTITDHTVTLVEVNEHAVREMERNIHILGRDEQATAMLAASEHALDAITSDATIVVDPPRAGLHTDVIERLLTTGPERIIYLSCNPVTQARDVAYLSERYGIRSHQGYNFFPRTPHIEHLVILDRIKETV